LMGKARLSVSLIRNTPVERLEKSCTDGTVDTEEALQKVYRDVIAVAPEHALAKEARMGLAESLSVTGRSHDAMAVYKPLILDPEAHPWKADASKKLDIEIRRLINAHSEQGEDLRIVELYYQYRSSVLLLEKQQEDGMQVAASLHDVGLLHPAADVYQDILTSKAAGPLKAESLLALGETYLAAGDDGHAERLLANYVADVPDGRSKASIRRRLADAEFSLGSYREAVEPYRAWNLFESQTKTPDKIAMFPSLLRLTEAYQRSDKGAVALKVLSELSPWAWEESDLLSTSDLLTLSDLLSRAKQCKDALRWYWVLLAREGDEYMSALGEGDREWVEYRVGRCLASLNKPEEAKTAFRTLLDRGTESHVAQLAGAYLSRLELQS